MFKKLRRISFTYKLLGLFLLTTFVPMLIVTLYVSNAAQDTLEEKTNDYLENIANVTISKLEDSIEYVEDTGFYIAGNQELKSVLLLEKKGELTQTERYEYHKEVVTSLTAHGMVKQEINAIYIESVSGMRYNFSKADTYFDFEILGIEEYTSSGEWLSIEDEIFFARSIDTYQEEGQLAILSIEVEPSVFYGTIQDIDYSGSGDVYLINRDDQIVVSQDTTQTGEELDVVYKELEKIDNVIYTEVIKDDVLTTVYVSQEISNGWRLLLAIPTEYYVADVIEMQQNTMYILLISSIIIVLVIIAISRQVTRPIKQLSKAMEEVGQGNLEVNCVVESRDEVGVLSQSFNQMVKDMNHLIQSEYEQTMMKQDAEMRSLQMQINPHFLYNTLDTINWMARIHELDDIGDITSSLGELMRYSLSKRAFVTIGDEIDNLKHYVEIQDVRYGDKMSVQFHVEEEISHCFIPKLLIQPILENAIVHGVEDKLEESIIEIHIYHEDEELFVIVEDDGVGMDQHAIEMILSDDAESKQGHTSIGVKNVNRRIQMVFGKDYGMQVQSVLGAGTKITLRMKLLSAPVDMSLDYTK